MPTPPEVGLFTRYVLENPYPLTIVLAALGGGLLWMGLREGRRGQLKLGGVSLIVAAGILITGLSVTTSGEHGKAVTRQFVDAVVNNDLSTAMSYIAPDASMAVGSPQNPGRNIDFIRGRLSDLNQRYPIESNRITSLQGYSESADSAVVHLSCSTAAGGFGPTPSRWVLHVQRRDDTWEITKITAISIAMRTPSNHLW